MFCRLAGHRSFPGDLEAELGRPHPKQELPKHTLGSCLNTCLFIRLKAAFPARCAWRGLDWGEVGLRAACIEVRPLQGPVGVWRGAGEGGSLEACPHVPLGVKGSGWAGHALRSQVRLRPWGWGSELGCFGGKQSLGGTGRKGVAPPEAR